MGLRRKLNGWADPSRILHFDGAIKASENCEGEVRAVTLTVVRDDVKIAIDELPSHSGDLEAFEVVIGSELGVNFQEALVVHVFF